MFSGQSGSDLYACRLTNEHHHCHKINGGLAWDALPHSKMQASAKLVDVSARDVEEERMCEGGGELEGGEGVSTDNRPRVSSERNLAPPFPLPLPPIPIPPRVPNTADWLNC